MDLQILLDAPDSPTSRVQIAKLGENFNHPRFGKFAITADQVKSWAKNLSLLPGGRALIDEDHSADRQPRRTEASGWITGIELDGDKAFAAIDWTDKGQDAIKNKRYLFFSPTYGPHADENGVVHDDVCTGGALTNKPFLNMPTITLASDERVSAWLEVDPAARIYQRALDGSYGEETKALVMLDVSQAERDQAAKDGHALPDGSYPIRNTHELHSAAVLAASGHGNVAGAKRLIRRRAKDLGVDVATLPGFGSSSGDSRAPMSKQLATALGIDDAETLTALDDLGLDEAVEKTLLDAVAAIKAPAAEPKTPDVKTLAQDAGVLGKVLLDATAFTELQMQAKAGANAAKQLHQARFDTAFDKALEARKVTTGEREGLAKFYELDADAAIKSLEDRQPIFAERPAGTPALELDMSNPTDPATAVANGVDPKSHDAYRKVQARLKQLDKGQAEFTSVMVQMMEAGEL